MSLTTRRDLRDIGASLLRRRWANPANLIDELAKMVNDHQRWLAHSGFEVAYERMVAAKEAEIATLSEALGLRMNTAAVREVHHEVEALNHRGDGLYDKTNLLHHDHVQDGRPGHYHKVLAAELIEQIEASFGTWLARYGYAAHNAPHTWPHAREPRIR